MNKWFRLALNSFIGIVVLQLLYSLLFGGGLWVGGLGALFVLGVKILYVLLVVGLIAGIFTAVKEFVLNKE